MLHKQLSTSSLSVVHRVVAEVLAQFAIGVMIATLATVAYAYLQYDDSILRVRLLLIGLEGIVVAWFSLMAFGVLFLIAEEREERRQRKGASDIASAVPA